MIRIILCILALGFSLPSFSADHYIRDGGTASTAGTGACTGWATANACDSLPATLVRGDTYWIADGTYPSRNFNTAVSGTTYIYIKKATTTSHGTETNWVSTYGDGEAVFSGSGTIWTISTNYIDIDGQVGNGKSPGGYGFRLFSTSNRCGSGTNLLLYGANITDLIVRHTEFDWNNGTSIQTDCETTRAWESGINTSNRVMVDSCYFHDSSGFVFYLGNFTGGPAQQNYDIKNSYFYRNGGGGGVSFHWEMMWLTDGNNFRFYNNIVEDVYGSTNGQTGWMMVGRSTNVYFYGNVFFCSTNCGVGNNGLIATWSNDTYVNNGIYIINNTFANITGGGGGKIYFVHNSANDANVVVKNNLYYNSSWSWTGVDTQSNEACGGGQSCSGTSSQTGIQSSIFVNYGTKDLRLASGTSAGDSSVGAQYNTDMLGNLRGGDGTWDRGAYEFGGAPDAQAPTTPTSPSAVAASSTQINLSWTASTDNVGIAGYNVERCTGSGCVNWAEVQVTSGTGTTWSDTGRTASTLYRYRIRARDAVPNYSGYSSIVEATTSAPAQFTVTPSESIGSANGTISPSTPQSVTQGTTTQFTITPNAGYQAFVTGTCGGSLVGTTYTTAAVNAPCTVVANFIPSTCVVAAAGTPINTAMTTQAGTFTYLFSVVPIVANHDIVLGHTNGAWVDYNSSATAVRFYSNGRIDVVSGAGYSSDVVYPYSAYTKYDVRVQVNIPAKTYSAWVAPEGGAETQIATNFAFRTSQAAVAQLNNFGVLAATGTPGGAYVCATGLSGVDTTAPTVQARQIVSSGSSFVLDLDEPAGSVSGYAGLTISASGGAVSLAGCSTASDIITCSTSRQILGAETVTASYSGSGGIADVSGNPLSSFSAQAVSNNSAQSLVALSLLTPPDGTRYRKEVSSTTIGLTTSKSASCRHASSTGIVWSSMTPYTTTGSTSHSSIFPLVAGGGYRVCSRCLDTAAQQYSTDSCTHFSVRSARKR